MLLSEMMEERLLLDTAERVARYFEDYDPYGFRDVLEAGETIEEGLQRATREAYSELKEGNYDTLIGWIFDPDVDDRLAKEQSAIIRQIGRLKRRNSRKGGASCSS